MKIRWLFIFYLSVLLSFSYTYKKSTKPITTYGNLALINGTLFDGIGGNPFENIDALLNVKMVVHESEIIKGGI